MTEIRLFVGDGDTSYMTDLARREKARGSIVGQSEIDVLRELSSYGQIAPEKFVVSGGTIKNKGCLVQLIRACLESGIITEVHLVGCFVDRNDTGSYANVNKRRKALIEELGKKIHDPLLRIVS